MRTAPVGDTPDGRDLARELVRFTRTSSRRHVRARTSAGDVFVDLYSTVLAGGCVLALVVSFVLALRDELVARSRAGTGLVDERWQILPQEVLWVGLTYCALVAVLVTARRLGPVAVPRAEGVWWLPLPVDRTPMIRPAFLLRVLAVVAGAFVLYVPFSLLTADTRTSGTHLVAAGTFGMGAGIAVGRAALRQAGSGRIRGADPLGLIGLVPLALLPFLAASPVPLLITALGAAALVAHLSTRVAAIPGVELVRGGAVSGHVGASVFLLDTNELTRALASDPRRAVAHRAAGFYARAVRSPFLALVRADVVAFLRVQPPPVGPFLWLLVCVVPVLVAPALPVPLYLAVVAVAGCGVASWSGAVARRTAIVPDLDALLPLSPVRVRCSRMAMPALVTATWLGALTSVLTVLGAAGPALILLGVVAGVGMGSGVVRAAFRPPTDWTMPLVDTPFGPVPGEQLGSLLRGVDTTVLAVMPLLLALYLGFVSPMLLLMQVVVSGIAVVVCAIDR